MPVSHEVEGKRASTPVPMPGFKTLQHSQPESQSTVAKSTEWDPIVQHYDSRFAQHGATPRGVDWPNGRDLATRFGVMMELLPEGGQPFLLDVGCGPGLLLDYLLAQGTLGRLRYLGVDLSEQMITAARARWPAHEFKCQDLVADPIPDQSVDVVIMNGVLTERVSLTHEQMADNARALVAAAYRASRIGVAFNVMNAHVDWDRADLFHWPFDAVAAFLKKDVSPHYSFRADYGLYEYTCFVRREPSRSTPPPGDGWWK